jgi:hypothetical protein
MSYSYWRDLGELRESIQRFLLSNLQTIDNCKISAEQRDTRDTIKFKGWPDTFEESLLDKKHIGSLWTTGDILFVLLENSENNMENVDKKNLRDTIEFLCEIYDIRKNEPWEYDGKVVVKGGPDEYAKFSFTDPPNYIDGSFEIRGIDDKNKQIKEYAIPLTRDEKSPLVKSVYNKIKTDGFPEKINVIREGSQNELKTDNENNIFACTSILMALVAAKKATISVDKLDTTIKNLVKDIINGFIEEEWERNLIPDPKCWTILPGREDASEDLYAIAAVMMSLSYTYKNYEDSPTKKDIINAIISHIENFFTKIDEDILQKIKNAKLSDITRIINSLCYLHDFFTTIENNEKTKINKIEEYISKLTLCLINRIHEAFMTNGRIYDHGRVSREINGDVIQFAGVDPSFVCLTLMLVLKRISGVDVSTIKEFNKNDRLRTFNYSHPLLKSLFRRLENQAISEVEAEKMNINDKEKVVGGYVWAGNDTSNPYAYQDIYFWQTAYAYWAISLYEKYDKETQEKLKQYKVEDLLKDKHNLIHEMEGKKSSLWSFIVYYTLFMIVFISKIEVWTSESLKENLKNNLAYIVFNLYLLITAIFSLYYFYPDDWKFSIKNMLKRKYFKLLPIDKLINKISPSCRIFVLPPLGALFILTLFLLKLFF